MKTDNLSSIMSRITGKTPPFWKKVRNYCLIAVAIAMAVKGAPQAGIDLPDVIQQIADYVLYICGTLTVAAQTTVDTPEDK